MLENIPQSLLDAVNLFALSPEVSTNERRLRNLRTVLKRYILPHYHFSVERLNHKTKVDQALAQVSLRDFTKAPLLFEQTVTALIQEGKEQGTIDNYKCVLDRFMRWMQSQKWYAEATGLYEGKYAPTIRARVSFEEARKGKRCYNSEPYSLKPSELTPKLEKQISQLRKYWTDLERPDRKDRKMRTVTFESRLLSILSFLGWLKNIESVPSEELDILQTSDLKKLSRFVAWGINERGNGYAWAVNIGKAALAIAKWKYGEESCKPRYRDIEEIEAVRNKMSEWDLKRRTEPKRTASPQALQEKLITLEQCIEVIKHLRRCCAPRTKKYVKRPLTGVLRSWQRYLLIAILTHCPVRQRELRELELGRTLIREADGYWVKLSPDDHKTGSTTGKGREYPLPEELTEDLDEWFSTWRPKVETDHNLAFISLGDASSGSLGKPMDAGMLGGLVKRTMFTATGYLFGTPKRTTPHDFRRIAITWIYKHGNPNQYQAVAEMMGHSVEEAMKTYSQLTSRDFTEKSKGWWKYKDPDSEVS